jgi:hypothetical protein
MSEKIKLHHLERKAVLYVRQSSAYQVAHNQESRKLQYAMKERLRQLGWQEIETVDEDLGRSAAGSVTRSGFERMVAEVCLGKVGAVAAREVSRFARNSREWQQCRSFQISIRSRHSLRSVPISHSSYADRHETLFPLLSTLIGRPNCPNFPSLSWSTNLGCSSKQAFLICCFVHSSVG